MTTSKYSSPNVQRVPVPISSDITIVPDNTLRIASAPATASKATPATARSRARLFRVFIRGAESQLESKPDFPAQHARARRHCHPQRCALLGLIDDVRARHDVRSTARAHLQK